MNRVVGKRKHVLGDRKGLDALVLELGGGAPKGVFRYRTQEEANAHWDRWVSERAQRRRALLEHFANVALGIVDE